MNAEAAIRLVEEHVRCENAHDLEGVLATFGSRATYDDRPWCDVRVGRDQVRSYYESIMSALPDLFIDVQHRYATGENVILEVIIRGTHSNPWRGLPATGHRVAIPLCAVYSFDENDRLAGERIYYDRATVLAQLGVFHEPQTLLGRALIALTHPVTMLGIAARRFAGKAAKA